MTEQEWLNGADPGFMLDHIEKSVSDRKFRLFAVACCRRVEHVLTDERSRRAIELTEQYADRLVPSKALEIAGKEAWQADEANDTGAPTPATVAALIAFYPPFDAAYTCGNISVLVDQESMKVDSEWWNSHEKEGEDEASYQAALLRCIIGNPFRRVNLDPTWLTARVIKLALRIYDDRAFDQVPELADALEQAGCTDADILSHCRQPGPHVRGCWVVDLLLGKQ
jgi:hypothetical protein